MTPYVLDPRDPDCDIYRANMSAFVDRLLAAGKRVRAEVGIYTKPRTDRQRKALFAAAYKPIMERMGLRGERDKDDLHAFWCGEYWGWHPELRNKPLRTTTRNERGERDVISTAEALDFYEFVQQRAAERGIDVPDPDPFWREKARKEAA